MAESSREFNEKAKEVREQFKNDKEKQTQELLKLQQEYLPAQLSGCLPLILQFIIFINIYSIIRGLISNGAESFNNIAYPFVEKVTTEIDTSFLNGLFDLKIAPNSAEVNILLYLFLVVLVGITQYFSMKILTGIRNKSKKKEEEKSTKKKKKNKKANEPEDFSEIMQRSTNQAMNIFPFLLMFISYGLPAGLSIYLITTSLFVILQQSIFYKIRERRELNTEKNS